MRFALRAAAIITLAGEPPARDPASLDAPLDIMRDAVVTVSDGRIERIEPYTLHKRHADTPLTDLGEVTLGPGLVNCHCHLELSHLKGKTVSGQGFVPWLSNLVSLIAAPTPETEKQTALTRAMRELAACGTAYLGDMGSRAPMLVRSALTHSAVSLEERTPALLPRPRMEILHFLEAFGFGPPAKDFPLAELAAKGYAPAAAAQMTPDAVAHCAVAGHALYSTSPEAVRAAHGWCRERGRPFSLHLAEFPEEVQCLAHGSGALFDLLSERLLPHAWKPPGMHPVDFAHALGLLDVGTLAVHCTQCRRGDMELLARLGVNVCLCPRSNTYINTGTAPAREMAEAGVLLCLGTDGLSSNHDLDLGREMEAALDIWDFSPQAALRMGTINGAHALGAGRIAGSLAPGKTAVFSLLNGPWAVRP